MTHHPLKIISLTALIGLLASQASLAFWLEGTTGKIAALLLALPLLLPINGIWKDRRYTYKWVGFLTLLYVAVGVSESFTNPELRLYGFLTLTFSCALYVSSMYYSRYLRGR